jgi:hypothetical protein
MLNGTPRHSNYRHSKRRQLEYRDLGKGHNRVSSPCVGSSSEQAADEREKSQKENHRDKKWRNQKCLAGVNQDNLRRSKWLIDRQGLAWQGKSAVTVPIRDGFGDGHSVTALQGKD